VQCAVRRGQIAFKDKAGRTRLVNFSEEDVLWLCRAVEAEGPVQREVAQCLVNLWALTCSRVKQPPSLTRIVRAYAQPVNPRWYLSGDLHQKWTQVDPVLYSSAHAVRREQVHSRLRDFSTSTVDAVHRALERGPLDVPKNATDYAHPRIDASRKYTALTEALKGRNRLWTRSRLWEGYFVP
jgi:hypothetical protein